MGVVGEGAPPATLSPTPAPPREHPDSRCRLSFFPAPPAPSCPLVWRGPGRDEDEFYLKSHHCSPWETFSFRFKSWGGRLRNAARVWEPAASRRPREGRGGCCEQKAPPPPQLAFPARTEFKCLKIQCSWDVPVSVFGEWEEMNLATEGKIEVQRQSYSSGSRACA